MARSIVVRAVLPVLGLIALLAAACSAGSSVAPAAPRSAAAPAVATPAAQALAKLLAEPALPAAPLRPEPWAEMPAFAGADAPDVSATSAVVLDEASGEVLYEKEGGRALAPASLTKIATAVIALERGRLDDVVTSDVDSRAMRGSTVMGLVPGDRFTLRDLLYGLMLPSGNDAALAIGRHIAGSDAAFVREMNRLALRLGLTQTRFANPHGLGARGHETSARDLAVLSRYAMTLPEFRTIVGASSWTAYGSRAISFNNINTFLFAYPGADGLKTGFTRRAGPTIVASAVRDGHRVYVVLLNAPSRELDAEALMDWAFGSFLWPPPGGAS